MTKVLVTGGRDLNDRQHVFNVLDQVHNSEPISFLIHGDCKGMDRLAGEWAESRNIPYLAVPANWTRFGNAAGPIRNARMIAMSPDVLIAFPGNSGTQDCIRRAVANKIRVIHAARYKE